MEERWRRQNLRKRERLCEACEGELRRDVRDINLRCEREKEEERKVRGEKKRGREAISLRHARESRRARGERGRK